ncbi:MAG: HD domain-containing protein [Candidatus Amesbacteria bacterium]|nr:HD domain-containing protein [Candidatus Amesbacteria bacterium]
MKVNLTPPAGVLDILKKFKKAKYEIYIVGGVVRDALLNKPLYDWDFTTNATPEEILKLFPEGFYDNKFGTVGIKNEEGRPYEITTFRTEENYTDNRHPDKISWGNTLEEDLKRRDFTINAIALNNKFEAIDPYNGQADLKNKLIRCVGNPNDRFGEDALRMMRAVRIAAQLGFTIEPTTLQAIQANASKIRHISAERIHDELLKLMASPYPADGYLLLHNSGLGAEILPEMEATFVVEQKSPGRHHIFDVGTHSVEALRHCQSPDPITRLATLIHDVGKSKTQRILATGTITFYNHEMESAKIAVKIADRLRFSNAEKDKFVRLVRWHQFTVDERQTDSAIRRFIKNVGLENIDDMIALRVGDRLGGGARATSWRLEEYKARILEVQKQPFSIPDLKISGKDVMELKNITPGPMVGKYLQMIFEEVEKGLVNEREVLLDKLTELQL